MSNKKNILLIIPNLGFGGAQRVFHDHSVALSKRFNVFECVFNTHEGVAYPTSNELIDLNVPGGSNIILKVFYFLVRIVKLRRVKRQYNIDVCISHLEGADYVNILSKGREKVVLCIHGSKLHDLNITGGIGWIRKKVLMPFLYKVPDKIITVSRDINPELIHGFGVNSQKVTTINNYFDLDLISAKAKEPLVSYAEVFKMHQVIITSGRLAIQKNQGALLLVFAELLKLHYCKLVFIGDGELRGELVSTSKSLGLKTYTPCGVENLPLTSYDVYFLGFQQNPFQFIHQATIFAFPSSWEGFPMALCEAMVCGVPVISTDCPTGPREILAPETQAGTEIQKAEMATYGILMPMLSSKNRVSAVQEWVKILYKVLNESALEKYYRNKASERVKDFSKDKIFKQWEDMLNNI